MPHVLITENNAHRVRVAAPRDKPEYRNHIKIWMPRGTRLSKLQDMLNELAGVFRGIPTPRAPVAVEYYVRMCRLTLAHSRGWMVRAILDRMRANSSCCTIATNGAFDYNEYCAYMMAQPDYPSVIRGYLIALDVNVARTLRFINRRPLIAPVNMPASISEKISMLIQDVEYDEWNFHVSLYLDLTHETDRF